MARRTVYVFDVVNVLLMLLLCVLIIYPFLYLLAVSLSDRFYVLQGSITLWPRGFTLKAYGLMLSTSSIARGFFNTLIYTVIGTTINVLLTTISAYPLSKKRFFGRAFFLKLVVVTMIFTGGIIPNYLLVVKLGLYNTLWALVLPTAIYAVYLLMAVTFFQTIPEEVEESATIDGASVYLIVFRIVIPLSMPMVAALVLFYSMYHYNSFFFPLIYLSDRAKFPLQVILRDMVISTEFLLEGKGLMSMSEYAERSLQYATIMISIVPVLLVYPFVQKYFIKGVMLGAVKG